MISSGIAFAAMLLAPAQDPKPVAAIDVRTGTLVIGNVVGEPIDEAIEVMRALLIRKLGGATSGSQSVAVFAEPVLYGQAGNSDAKLSGQVVTEDYMWGSGNPGYRAVATAHEPRVEGVYLGGYGVVFTVTLPATDRDPLPGAGAPKESSPLSEWEREQRRLRGEPMPERTGVVPKEPPVGDVLLKLLAENGKHFTSLKDDDRVTIAVTFRASAAHAKPVTANSGSSTTLNEQRISGTLSFTGGGTVSVVGQPQSVRDHELLGDLHLKQGQPDSAIEAYRKAVKLAEKESSENPSQANTDRHRDALIKLAQAYLAAGREQEGRSTMQTAVNYTGKIPPVATPANQPTATARPARLSISASKKLLDQVGNGKISLDEFRKQAMVEYGPTARQLKEPPAP